MGSGGFWCVLRDHTFEECPPSFDDSDCGFVDIVSSLDENLVFDGGPPPIVTAEASRRVPMPCGCERGVHAEYPNYTIT